MGETDRGEGACRPPSVDGRPSAVLDRQRLVAFGTYVVPLR